MRINARTVEVVITTAHDDQTPSVEDCALVSRRVGDIIEHASYLGDVSYSLNVSTPGTSDLIETPKQLQAFRGFPVRLTTRQPIKGKTEFFGSLGKCTESGTQLIVKGRLLNFEAHDVIELRLCKASELPS
ncbi:Ribosome maturation factor RimP [Gracilariopsis chorda]|uniref:Ribosome maturation factor RimP n=1 Tax=Gracilariopsis chorda TaxID=448386 RepID=A0A2V3J5W9_9FLOR|nr:Ribosome maturation factor RimP [Gracilariopsis chorda]|eukprot:PXF49805.1 Ribosome maturation factor RimP [Gracilariopsis chorda]